LNSKSYRLGEFINPSDGRSLIVEASAGLSLGPLPGLEDFSGSVIPILPFVDGIVASPGGARRLAGRSRQDAALLVRADWSNALRGPEFVLPPETISHLPLLTAQDALDLGASGLVIHFLLGHEERIEAGCLNLTVQAALAGSKIGMPLIVDVQPIGPRVVLPEKAIELGVSYALEGGADGVAVPWPGKDSFETVIKMAAGSPVWVKPTSLENSKSELESCLELGGSGLWLGEAVFNLSDTPGSLQSYNAALHGNT
jgi:DhnA family fructose-bisphosphate aldolase class Ia